MSTLYHWMATILVACYSVTHNYALAIALLTLMTVALTTPLTWKSSRGMIAMQVLQPEMKKLQAKYKGDRAALNEEMQKLYREHGINPLAGCLPLVPQMIVFYILYHTIDNLSHRLSFTTLAAAQRGCPPGTPAGQIIHAAGKYTCASPSNVSLTSDLYRNLILSGGHMKVYGFDLSQGARSAHGSALIGAWILVALVVAAQYWQTRQVNRRNPAAASNPQAKMMQRIFPVFFGLISISIQAGVNVYFLVSALCRIGQQSLMFRYDPVLKRQLHAARSGKPVDLPPRSVRATGGAPDDEGSAPFGRGGGLARLLGLTDPNAAQGAGPSAKPPPGKAGGSGNLERFLGEKGGVEGTLSNGRREAPKNGGGPPRSGGGGARGHAGRNRAVQPPRPADRNRSRSKKTRRPR